MNNNNRGEGDDLDLRKIYWKTSRGEKQFIEDFAESKIPIEANIIPTVDVVTNRVAGILISSPDRARSFIEMESTWDAYGHRDEIKQKHISNLNFEKDVEMFMRGFLKRERKSARVMFTVKKDLESLKNDPFSIVNETTMYAIDYGVFRKVDVNYLKPLKPSERLSPFGLQAMLYDEKSKLLDLSKFDGGNFRHFCLSCRHMILVEGLTYCGLGIPTAHIRVLPPDTFPEPGLELQLREFDIDTNESIRRIRRILGSQMSEERQLAVKGPFPLP